MEDATNSAKVIPEGKKARRSLWVRLIHHAIREARRREAQKQREAPPEKAARITARATNYIALFTLIIVVANLGTLWVMKKQLKEMHDGGVDTHNLAVAAGNQATWTQNFAKNMQTQADRTKDLADRMKDQADRTKTIADQAVIQANEAKVAAAAAQSAANTAKSAMVIGNRPWIKIDIQQTGPLVFLPDGSAQIGIQQRTENVGSSVALRVFTWFDILPFGSMPNPFSATKARQKEWCDANRFPKSTMSGEEMFPHDPILYPSVDFKIPKEHVVPVTDKGLKGKVGFILVGCVTYRSSFEGPTVASHETMFQYMIGKPVGQGGFLPYVDPIGVHPDYIIIRVPDGLTAD